MRILVLTVILTVLMGCHSTPPQVTPKIPESELGDKAFGGGDYSEAIEYYNLWLVKYPQDADVFFQRGRAYYKLGKYDEALQDFEASVKYYPKNLRAQVYSCLVLNAQYKNEEARRLVTSTISHPLFFKLPYYELFLMYLLDGSLKNQAGNFDSALTSLEEAIKIYNLHPDVFRNYGNPTIKRLALHERAITFCKLGDHNKQMAADMEEYITLTKQMGATVDADDYKTLAIALWLTGQHEKCKQVLVNLNNDDRRVIGQAVDDVDMFIQQ